MNGEVPSELVHALERCRASCHALFLVTGRRFETITLGHLGKLFLGVVWENGAVLAHMGTGELYLPFGQLSARLLKPLGEREWCQQGAVTRRITRAGRPARV